MEVRTVGRDALFDWKASALLALCSVCAEMVVLDWVRESGWIGSVHRSTRPIPTFIQFPCHPSTASIDHPDPTLHPYPTPPLTTTPPPPHTHTHTNPKTPPPTQQDLHETYEKQEGQLPTAVLTALTEFGRPPRVVRLQAPPVYGALDAMPSEEDGGGEGVSRGSRRLATPRWVSVCETVCVCVCGGMGWGLAGAGGGGAWLVG